MIIDAHCDTISVLAREGGSLKSNRLQLDLDRMHNKHVQFFASFVNVQKAQYSPIIHILNSIEKLYAEVEENSDILEIALNYDDIIRITNNKKCAVIMSLEGGDAIEGEISIVRILYKLGIRCIGLTWNYKNKIGCGILEEIDTGISEFGHNLIKEMNNLGILIDVSHLGELGFWHVINYSKYPIIASHSNAYKICQHKRNLHDGQIMALAKNKGVIGINFNPDFLNQSGNSSVEDIINHIEYIASLIGIEHIGLGSDFDGIEIVPKGVEDVSKLENIFNELAKKNYSQTDIEMIAGGNFLRVIKEVVG